MGKKVNQIVSDVVEKASETGKKGVEFVSDGSKILAREIMKGAKELSARAKEDSYNRRLKKFSPLFLEEYNSADFFVPNIICIVDDAVRRDIDVCDGAIGWREKKKGVEFLFLYDEFAENSGLQFVPCAICDEIYYVDPYDRKRFIKLNSIFQQTHEEKLAELEHIAYSLGAKSCTVQIDEAKVQKRVVKSSAKRKTTVKLEEEISISQQERATIETKNHSNLALNGGTIARFKGNRHAVEPQLKWFSQDSNILNLIDYRIKGGNKVTSKTLRLSGASSATMSCKAACSIEEAMGEMGIRKSFSLEAQTIREHSLTMVYHVEF